MTLAFNKLGLLTDNVGYESKNIKVGFIIENSLHLFIKFSGKCTGLIKHLCKFMQIGFLMSFWHNRNIAPTGAIF